MVLSVSYEMEIFDTYIKGIIRWYLSYVPKFAGLIETTSINPTTSNYVFVLDLIPA